jgi:NADH:ubiquinone oxidoreductase subunit B-like Fe-S oxidoreductase
MTVIKKGYRVTVKTWENDADNYNSGAVEGLSRPEAAFLVEFVKLFSSKNDHRNRGIGNMYEPRQSEIVAAEARIKEVVEKHKATIEDSEMMKEYFLAEDGSVDEGGWHEYAYEMTLTGGEFYTRVMESFKVEFIPQDIVLEDVTKEFK